MTEQRIAASYTRMPHYQVYYWQGLAAHCRVSVTGGPWWYRVMPMPDLAHDAEGLFERMKGCFGRKSTWDARRVDQFVAEYRWSAGGRQISFAIDAHDGKEIFAPELLERCDLYFKANKWREEPYPDKVLPVVNGNGFLRQRHLDKLRSMRSLARDNDVLFISRIWGGVEHNVRLFEALAKLPCRKQLMAIFVKGVAGEQDTAAAISRLETAGVECTFDLLPVKELWQRCSSSKIVMLRAGKYLCIPWRMIDLLCMGSCIVTDSDFEPQWPEPLEAGRHYLSAGIDRPPDTSAADRKEYEKLTATITGLLADDEQIRGMQTASAGYFDIHATPERVGAYILDRLQKFVQSGS
ncbi:hypothetical protein ACFL0S_02680 [Thermodesulfobacteriota bacterium]